MELGGHRWRVGVHASVGDGVVYGVMYRHSNLLADLPGHLLLDGVAGLLGHLGTPLYGYLYRDLDRYRDTLRHRPVNTLGLGYSSLYSGILGDRFRCTVGLWDLPDGGGAHGAGYGHAAGNGDAFGHGDGAGHRYGHLAALPLGHSLAGGGSGSDGSSGDQGSGGYYRGGTNTGRENVSGQKRSKELRICLSLGFGCGLRLSFVNPLDKTSNSGGKRLLQPADQRGRGLRRLRGLQQAVVPPRQVPRQ